LLPHQHEVVLGLSLAFEDGLQELGDGKRFGGGRSVGRKGDVDGVVLCEPEGQKRANRVVRKRWGGRATKKVEVGEEDEETERESTNGTQSQTCPKRLDALCRTDGDDGDLVDLVGPVFVLCSKSKRFLDGCWGQRLPVRREERERS
jgi:hypothetical protein